MRRHDLLRPSDMAWADMLAANAKLADLPMVASWAADGRPVVVRRYFAGEPIDAVPAALALPPSLEKQRVAISFAPGSALRPLPPMALIEARGHAPQAWQGTIDGLLALGETERCHPHVFGALLWQQLTGLKYLSATSDLDLLWAPANAASAARLVAGLRMLDADGPVRLDGEIVLPDGGGVNWRELLGGTEMVLVKTLQTVEMRACESLFV